METGSGRTMLEETLLEILARLPLRSITRFKSVSKTWKSMIESTYFRSLFLSQHKNLSTSWSLMFTTRRHRPITEAIGYHKCKTWDLPKSLGSYIFPFKPYPNIPTFDYLASSNGLVWIRVYSNIRKFFVGNPVLQQWVEIPKPPCPWPCTPTGLVTRVDEDGLVSSFKVVMTLGNISNAEWRVYVYSSESGLWKMKLVLSPVPLKYARRYSTLSLNGVIYLLGRVIDPSVVPHVLLAHDFYSHEADNNQFRVIPLPLPYNCPGKRCLTTSGGDAIYIEIVNRKLKVWRLSSECWQLLWEEIDMASVGFDVDCIPMTMNPFDSDIVYLWSLQHDCFVSGNLRRQEFIVHQESWSSSEGCFHLNTADSKGYINDSRRETFLGVSQFILPQWMHSVPRPPN